MAGGAAGGVAGAATAQATNYGVVKKPKKLLSVYSHAREARKKSNNKQ